MTRARVRWVHGYTMDSTLWGEMWCRLPEFEHLAGDLPGHGRNPTSFAGRSLSSVAGELADELVAQDCRSLVGLSFGSMIALQVAIDRPEVLDHLVLAAPTLAGPDDDRAAALKYFQLVMAARMGVGPRQLADLWMASPPDIFTGVNRDPELRARVAEVVRRHSWAELLDGSMAALRSAAVQDAAALQRITAAVTVVIGSQDMPRFRSNAALLGSAVPGCRVIEVPGAGHLPLLENPGATAGPLAQALAPVSTQVLDIA